MQSLKKYQWTDWKRIGKHTSKKQTAHQNEMQVHTNQKNTKTLTSQIPVDSINEIYPSRTTNETKSK